MTQPQKLVIAKFTARPGEAGAVSKVINACVAPSRSEEGNLKYDVYRSTENEDVFLIHEVWKDDEAIRYHFTLPHFLQLIDDSKPLLLSDPEIQSVDLP